MSSIVEIKNRIASVSDTRKITNAMYLISSRKLQKARLALEGTRPYLRAVHEEIAALLIAADGWGRYLAPADFQPRAEDECLCLLVTADRGLAGGYNRALLHAAEDFFAAHPRTRFLSVGEEGRRLLPTIGCAAEGGALLPSVLPTLDDARRVTERLVEPYESGAVRAVYAIYTDMKNALSESVVTERLLPVEAAAFSPGVTPLDTEGTELFPDAAAVLDALLRSRLLGCVFGLLTDAFCAEQNARMRAMSTANDNADELLSALSLEYNRLRQAAITQEITEVSAGARAQQSLHSEVYAT